MLSVLMPAIVINERIFLKCRKSGEKKKKKKQGERRFGLEGKCLEGCGNLCGILNAATKNGVSPKEGYLML